MKKICFASILLCIMLSSCGLWNNVFHPPIGKLSKRYDVATLSKDADLNNYISVEGFVLAPKPSPDLPTNLKSLFSLPASSQKQLIIELSKKNKKSSPFLTDIKAKLEDKDDPGAASLIEDYTSFKRRFIISVRNKSPMPEDRISKLYIELTEKDPVMNFTSTSYLATDFESINLANQTYSKKNTFSSSLNATSGVALSNGSTSTSGTSKSDSTQQNIVNNSSSSNQLAKSNAINNSIGGSVGFNSERDFSEEVALKQRYVNVSASISNNQLSVVQESTMGIDLSGNILLDVEFKCDPTKFASQRVFSFSNLVVKDALTKPDKIEVREYYIKYPDIANNDVAKISFEGVFRKVTGNGNTISEADDFVTFYQGKGNGTKDVIVFTPKELVPKFWKILYNNNPVQIKSPATNTTEDLIFSSYENPTAFLLWLKNSGFQNGPIGKGYILFYKDNGMNNQPLTQMQIQSLYISIAP
ncbi:hypothetical protein [Mucilaginibacter sp.]|uniref:hypothetical protein n=1 Tax=Mucilaginibacter sp. TaxID=1882438 RepID=UPI003D0BB2C1